MLERQTGQTIAHFLLDFLYKKSVSGGQRSLVRAAPALKAARALGL
jgi:hypothetical protein